MSCFVADAVHATMAYCGGRSAAAAHYAIVLAGETRPRRESKRKDMSLIALKITTVLWRKHDIDEARDIIAETLTSTSVSCRRCNRTLPCSSPRRISPPSCVQGTTNGTAICPRHLKPRFVHTCVQTHARGGGGSAAHSATNTEIMRKIGGLDAPRLRGGQW